MLSFPFKVKSETNGFGSFLFFQVVLFVDGHKSHISSEAAEYCAANGIALFTLLPNSTHLIQPFDVGIFGPLKHKWKEQVLNFVGRNMESRTELTKYNFTPLLKAVFNTIQSTPDIAAHAFKKSGLYPFTVQNIDRTRLLKLLEKEVDSKSNLDHRSRSKK
jgi:hypothetical protein